MFAPPEPVIYPTLELLIEAVNTHAKGMLWSRSKKDKNKEVIIVYLRCDRGGRYSGIAVAGEGMNLRTTGSRLIDCSFQRLDLARVKSGTYWSDHLNTIMTEATLWLILHTESLQRKFKIPFRLYLSPMLNQERLRRL